MGIPQIIKSGLVLRFDKRLSRYYCCIAEAQPERLMPTPPNPAPSSNVKAISQNEQLTVLLHSDQP